MEHTPLGSLGSQAAGFALYESMLSELAAPAFEYGYSVARPDALVLWEAQFGDFANGEPSSPPCSYHRCGRSRPVSGVPDR
ncbi:hypothetical protein OG395_09650 [Streptomyces sp. NBC_01320]|nr:hypothetical protein OG395_09650 [Streptomyces sp. NBC_01320]